MPLQNQPGTVGARGPLNPQKFFLPPPPENLSPVVSEEDSDWWVSIQKCGAVAALAAAALITASTTQAIAQYSYETNDISAAGTTPAIYSSGAPPTVILSGNRFINYAGEDIVVPQHPAVQPEEDFWSPQIPPTQWAYIQPITDDVVIVPQPVIFQPDEDFWQNPAPPPVTYLWPQQFSFDQNDVSAAGNTSAVYSSGSPPTVILQGANRIFLSYPDDTVPQPAVANQPDEDFWQVPLPPSVTYGPLYLPDQENIPAGNLSATAEELYWQNPTVPVPGSLAWLQQFLFDEQAPSLFGQPDEDFWQNPTPPVTASLLYPQQWAFDEQFPALLGQPDEDFWQNPAAPVPATLLGTKQEIFDEQFPLLFGVPNEDYWTLQIPSQLWQVPVQAITDDEIIVQQPSFFQPDEDFWTPQIPPQLWLTSPIQATSDDEVVGQPSTQTIDELFFAPLLTCVYPNYLMQQWQFETGDNGGLVPPPVVIPKFQILRWSSVGSRITPPYNP